MAAVELACGSLFMCLLTMLALDVSVLMLGYEVNDRACRDACRAAAQEENAGDAQKAAQVCLKAHKTDGTYVSAPTLLTSGTSNFVYRDFNGDPLAGNPTVTVTTECLVKTPVPLFMFGQNFGHNGSMVSSNWKFQKRYTFPIVTFNLKLPS